MDNSYLDTVSRLEPDIAMVDQGAALTSIAISLKRIADAMAAPPGAQDAYDAAAFNQEALEVLEALATNPYVDLGDIIYEVREREGKNWAGPHVNAWRMAVSRANAILKKSGHRLSSTSAKPEPKSCPLCHINDDKWCDRPECPNAPF